MEGRPHPGRPTIGITLVRFRLLRTGWVASHDGHIRPTACRGEVGSRPQAPGTGPLPVSLSHRGPLPSTSAGSGQPPIVIEATGTLGAHPEQLGDVAHKIRLGGNAGAHPDKDGLKDVTEDDARRLLEFLEDFVRYVYEIPGRLQAMEGGRS